MRTSLSALSYPSMSPSANSIISRARKYGYEDTIHIVQYLLKECSKARSEDERTEIVEKIFSVLNKNPMILVFEPEFRESVINKMNELEKHINNQHQALTKARFDEAILMMKKAIYLNVSNSVIRVKAIIHLNKVVNALDEYAVWNNRSRLTNQFTMLNSKLNEIKAHPCYKQSV
jgi:hypothetical protein